MTRHVRFCLGITRYGPDWCQNKGHQSPQSPENQFTSRPDCVSYESRTYFLTKKLFSFDLICIKSLSIHYSRFTGITFINQSSLKPRFAQESSKIFINCFSRISTSPGWWMMLRKINDVLAQHDSIYEEEAQESGNPSKTSTEKSKF